MGIYEKTDRILSIFLSGIKGEDISVNKLADYYSVSPKTISRDVNSLKAFLADNRELAGNAELEYSARNHSYRLIMDDFLLSKELLIIIKVLIGSRALRAGDLNSIVAKLKKFTTPQDKHTISKLISNELYNYNEVYNDCRNSIDLLWQITGCIDAKKEITIDYYKMDRSNISRRILPAAIMFSEYYFYLIAFHNDNGTEKERFYRLDRITHITEHRSREIPNHEYNEGELRSVNQYMFPGRKTFVKFEFTGPSVQAVLDKLPTARVTGIDGKKNIITAEVYGEGIKLFLLSQGSWVKVLEPQWLVDELKEDINKMAAYYN